jgi:crotonobetainyl-CoA:carnitine CoA-transferase CaiB-like acyl-CoA transferase
VTSEHPEAGPLPLLASPLRLSATPVVDYPAPPTLGQHTREVLRERLGFTDTDLGALAAREVI